MNCSANSSRRLRRARSTYTAAPAQTRSIPANAAGTPPARKEKTPTVTNTAVAHISNIKGDVSIPASRNIFANGPSSPLRFSSESRRPCSYSVLSETARSLNRILSFRRAENAAATTTAIATISTKAICFPFRRFHFPVAALQTRRTRQRIDFSAGYVEKNQAGSY